MTNCIKCGNCCKRFEAVIDQEKEENARTIAAIKKVFADGKMKMVLSRYDQIKIRIEGPCQHLDENNRCRIYEDRPDICKNFYCEKSLNTSE